MSTSPAVMWARRLRRDLRLAHMVAYVSDLAQGGRLEQQQRRWQRELAVQRQLGAVGSVDWMGTRRVSLDEFERFLLELRNEVRATGARFVAISMSRRLAVENNRPVVLEYRRRLATLAARGEIELVDGRAAFGRALRNDVTVRELLVDDYHPSALGHEILATALAEAIEKSGSR